MINLSRSCLARRIDDLATVLVGGLLLLVDVQGFQHYSLPVDPF